MAPPLFNNEDNQVQFAEFISRALQARGENPVNARAKAVDLFNRVANEDRKTCYDAIREATHILHEAGKNANLMKGVYAVQQLLIQRTKELEPDLSKRMCDLSNEASVTNFDQLWDDYGRTEYEHRFVAEACTATRLAEKSLLLLDRLPLERIFDLWDPAPDPLEAT